MSKVHENLENKSFSMPSGIVTTQVCSKSGRLPIAGVCDDCVITEYFAEGTVPTETCDVHYTSNVCAYSGLTACENCPFQMTSTVERIPDRLQDSSLGTTTTTDSTTLDENGLPITGDDTTTDTTTTDTTQMCPHNAEFFALPNAQELIAQQQAQLLQQQQLLLQQQQNAATTE